MSEMVKLVYHEKLGLHCDGTHSVNTEWACICASISLNQAAEFVQEIEKKYPGIGSPNAQYYPKAAVVKQEFAKFLMT